MKTLPTEVLIRIFTLLPRGKGQDLLSAALTCKLFRQCIDRIVWENVIVCLPSKARAADRQASLKRLGAVLRKNPDLPGFIKSLTLSIQAPLPAIIPLDCLDLIENLPNLQHFNYNPQGWTQGNVPNTLKELPKDLDVQLSSLTLDLKDMRDPDFPKEFVYDFTQIPWLRCMRIINASDIFRIWEESPKRFPWKVLSVAKCYPTPGDWNINPATQRSETSPKRIEISIGWRKQGPVQQGPLTTASLRHQMSIEEVGIEMHVYEQWFHEEIDQWTFTDMTSLKTLSLPCAPCLSTKLYRIVPPQLEVLKINYSSKLYAYANLTAHFKVIAYNLRALARKIPASLPHLKTVVWRYRRDEEWIIGEEEYRNLQVIAGSFAEVGVAFVLDTRESPRVWLWRDQKVSEGGTTVEEGFAEKIGQRIFMPL